MTKIAVDSSQVLGVVLAGGQSSRMGVDKAMLQINGRTLLQHARQTLHQAGIERVLLSANQHRDGIADRVAQCGPLSGIDAIIHAPQVQSAAGILVLPVDMPAMSAKALCHLWQQCLGHGQAGYFQHTPLPCYLPLGAALLQVVETLLEQQQYALKQLLQRLNAQSLPLPADCDQQMLSNLNTPQQWQSYVLTQPTTLTPRSLHASE